MANTRPRRSLERFLPHREGTDALSDRVRMLLVRTLYTQPTSLAIGAANGAISSAVAAFLGGERLLFILAAALTAVAIARVAMAFYLPAHTGSGDVRKLEIAYEVGAFAYSLVLGLVAAATILCSIMAAPASPPGCQPTVYVHDPAPSQHHLGQMRVDTRRPAPPRGRRSGTP